MLTQAHYLSGHLSTSRFNRRLHALADWLSFILATRAEVFRHGEVCVLDGMPLPVCTRVRARRWGKVRGRIYCGYCAAKQETCFGWRRHLGCTPAGVPVTVTILPASVHDLILVQPYGDPYRVR